MEKLQKKNPVLIFIIVNYLHYLGRRLLWLFPKPISSVLNPSYLHENGLLLLFS